jgi:hypothetical protein
MTALVCAIDMPRKQANFSSWETIVTSGKQQKERRLQWAQNCERKKITNVLKCTAVILNVVLEIGASFRPASVSRTQV